MTITPSQRTTIMKLWAKVCKDHGWKPGDREFRLAKFSEIIGRPIASADEIERIDECTRLMKELAAMLGANVQAAREADNTRINRARVLRTQIVSEIIPCLELYIEDVRAYVTGIMADKNRWWKIDRPAREITVMDLDAEPIFRPDKTTGQLKEWPSQLEQLQYTLSARLSSRRKENVLVPAYRHLQGTEPLTLHEMKTAVGVKCKCATFCCPGLLSQE
jgi:hypothetical protein